MPECQVAMVGQVGVNSKFSIVNCQCQFKRAQELHHNLVLCNMQKRHACKWKQHIPQCTKEAKIFHIEIICDFDFFLAVT